MCSGCSLPWSFCHAAFPTPWLQTIYHGIIMSSIIWHPSDNNCPWPQLLWSHHRNYTFNRLSQFFSFHLILSDHFRLRTVRRFSTRTHLSHALHIFTNTCLPHDKPCSIKLNFIFNSSFLCCAWLCCHTHAHHTCYASLPFCHHHVVASCL